jgi:glycosyltransferase involved in cell wall biosynthesis
MFMSRPLVSCILPVYNGERYLAAALDSIVAQTHRPLQIIVVDDGSTDGTPALAAGHPFPIRYHRQPNAGPAAACNRGLALAAGEFIAFLEQDDLWHSHKLAHQLDALDRNPEREYCVTEIQDFWESALDTERLAFAGHPRGRPQPGYLTQSLLARRRLFERIGGFDEALRYAHAAEWFLRCRRNRVAGILLPRVLVHRRLHGQNASRTGLQQCHEEFLRLLHRHLAGQRGEGCKEPALSAITT